MQVREGEINAKQISKTCQQNAISESKPLLLFLKFLSCLIQYEHFLEGKSLFPQVASRA